MPLKFDVVNLKHLMEDFYILTGIRMVLFDNGYNELLSYPDDFSPFCSYMQSNKDTSHKCYLSNLNSFENCKKTKDLIVYKCHAGLIEATAPLKESGIIIGYVMFGQITDQKNRKKLFQEIMCVCENYDLNSEEILSKAKGIKYKSRRQILAAAKILDACTNYILLKELVSLNKNQIFNQMLGYMDTHLEEDIKVSELCKFLGVSRTKLYEITKQYISGGIANYIRNKRFEKAKELLKNSDLTITEISGLVGFNDYNNFCRVFKKMVGQSPKKFRDGAD